MHDRDSCAKLTSFKIYTLSQGQSVKERHNGKQQKMHVMQILREKTSYCIFQQCLYFSDSDTYQIVALKNAMALRGIYNSNRTQYKTCYCNNNRV